MIESTKVEAIPYSSTRKRSILRGVVAGLLAFAPVFLIGVFFAFVLKAPIVYLFGLDNTLPAIKGAWNEADWYVIPPAAFFSSFVRGWIVAVWAPPKNRAIIWVFLTVSLAFAFNDPLPDANTPIKLAIWGLSGALGLVLGNESYHWYERRSA